MRGCLVLQVVLVLLLVVDLPIEGLENKDMIHMSPLITRTKRGIYQGTLARDLTGKTLDDILIFGLVKTTEELSATTEDDKTAALIEAVKDNSVHSSSDLQSWAFYGDGQSVTSLAGISFFLESRQLKSAEELQQMSFQHQYDVMVLQMARYDKEELTLRNMTVLDLVIREILSYNLTQTILFRLG